MSENTAIEWTDATWNPITGCSVVSPGCTNCYAMKLAGRRLKSRPSRIGLTRDTNGGPVWTGEVRLNEEWLTQPLQWGRPRRVFVCAHGDLFHESVPDEWIDKVFGVMAACDRHTFQVLTKRPERMLRWFESRTPDEFFPTGEPEEVNRWKIELRGQPQRGGRGPGYDNCGLGWPLRNVWIGVSVEDQRRADERIPLLLRTPAAVRWLSCEPLLGGLDFRWAPYAHQASSETYRQYLERTGRVDQYEALRFVDWIVAGGESGHGARPMHPDWARSLRDQCVAAGVPFFFKQWGAIAPIDAIADHGFEGDAERAADVYLRNLHATGIVERSAGGSDIVVRCGKKAAGRVLDGRTWDGYPESPSD